jgi:hypothetical protein
VSGDPIPAVLLQLADHEDRLAGLDEREAGHFRAAQQRLGELADLVAELGRTLEGQTAVLERLEELAGRIPAVAGPGDRDGDGVSYEPSPVPRWWNLSGAAREEALGKLRGWVEQVYRPGYGQLAATLGACWEQHPLCVYGLDVLSELWSVLYLQTGRSPAVLSAQAEFHARIVPAIAEQLMTETTRCRHARTRASGGGAAGSQG